MAASQTLAITRIQERGRSGKLPAGRRFPFTVTLCAREAEGTFKPALPALRKNGGALRKRKVGITDLTLRSDRKLVVDGNVIDLPLGVKSYITGKALKKIAGAYVGGVVMKWEGNAWVRVRDDDVVRIPENGPDTELKSMPSFQLE